MLETPVRPRKYRKLPSQAHMAEPCGVRAQPFSPYTTLSPKRSGMPNSMHYGIGPGPDLEGVVLCSTDLRWSNFRSSNLRDANLRASILWGAILTHANLCGADLCYADLTGVDLVGADLSDARVEGACFMGARYSKTTRFPAGFGDPTEKGMISLMESIQIN